MVGGGSAAEPLLAPWKAPGSVFGCSISSCKDQVKGRSSACLMEIRALTARGEVRSALSVFMSLWVIPHPPRLPFSFTWSKSWCWARYPVWFWKERGGKMNQHRLRI